VLFDKTEGDFSFSSFTAAIRVVNSTALDARFLHRYLHWVYVSGRTETMQSHSTGIRNLNGDAYKAIKVAYPPLTEQRRIVAILDEAFEGIATAKANADKNLQNARELFDNALQSLLHDSDGGRVRRSMADVCDIPSKLVDPREEKYQDSPHVGAGNIETKTGALIDVLTARQEQLISGKFLFDESMVLYSKIRPYLMKVVRPDFNGLCSADIYPLAPKYGVIGRDYLFYLLLSPDFTAYAIKGSARAGMPKVNREHLFAYEFSLPSVQEQEQIAARLDALAEETQRLIAVYERKLAALEELKKSLLHQAFSGQL
jgi:type I restriction enzyme S subunit